MTRVFLDTGYLIALNASDDQHHKQAQQHWNQFLNRKPLLITTSYIFDEVTTFFNSRNRHEKAVEIGKILLHSSSITLFHVNEELFHAGWNTFQLHPDKRFSLTDCISFEVMTQENLKEVLGFDKHFEQAGFVRLPV